MTFDLSLPLTGRAATVAADLFDIEVFEGLPAPSVARLAMLSRERVFEAGTILMRQGDSSDRMYVILRGRVLVERAHPDLIGSLLLAEVGSGGVVGEIGLLDGRSRPTTVTALEDVAALELNYDSLAVVLLQYPEASSALMKTLVRRLRAADELLMQILLARDSESARETAP